MIWHPGVTSGGHRCMVHGEWFTLLCRGQMSGTIQTDVGWCRIYPRSPTTGTQYTCSTMSDCTVPCTRCRCATPGAITTPPRWCWGRNWLSLRVRDRSPALTLTHWAGCVLLGSYHAHMGGLGTSMLNELAHAIQQCRGQEHTCSVHYSKVTGIDALQAHRQPCHWPVVWPPSPAPC